VLLKWSEHTSFDSEWTTVKGTLHEELLGIEDWLVNLHVVTLGILHLWWSHIWGIPIKSSLIQVPDTPPIQRSLTANSSDVDVIFKCQILVNAPELLHFVYIS
jgi:hypothetical protein